MIAVGFLYWLQASQNTVAPSEGFDPYPMAYPAELSSSMTATAGVVFTQKAVVAAEGTRAAIEFTTSPQPTPSPVSTGIYENWRIAMQWRQLGLEVENAWIGYIGRMEMNAWAGAEVAESDQGGVQVIVYFPKHPISQWFPSPEPVGSLHIVGENNNRLILESKQGVTLYFDMPSLQYAESLDQVLATVTPPPTLGP